MDENFEALLKTEEQNIKTNQTKEDVLRFSKIKIKRMCCALCLPSKDYNPQKTVDAIKNYLKEKSTRERILYSEISSFVYGLEEDEQGNFATNIDNLLSFSLDETNKVDEDHCKIIIKIYDHFQLALHQKSLNSNTKEVIKNNLVNSMDSAKETISREVKEDVKHIEKEYISILGIFAAIVLAFVGGVTFSTSVLQNINAISIYRLILVIDFLAFILANTIYILIRFICHINDKEIKLFKIRWFNIIIGVIGILVIIAWTIDAKALADFIEVQLPWIK